MPRSNVQDFFGGCGAVGIASRLCFFAAVLFAVSPPTAVCADAETSSVDRLNAIIPTFSDEASVLRHQLRSVLNESDATAEALRIEEAMEEVDYDDDPGAQVRTEQYSYGTSSTTMLRTVALLNRPIETFQSLPPCLST